MALASKQKRHISSSHKKRQGLHQKRTQRFVKTYWPYIPMVGIVGLSLVVNFIWTSQTKTSAVLGYTTDVSVPSLLQGTNDQRTANSLPALNLNGQLDSAAQSKANDMVTRDYWSHNTPDGQTPWSFILAANYSYQTAGENLAYGFDTSAQTISGWMNSPEHRANVLNTSYKDIGFGIANSPNYQASGAETVIVAMYASPYAPVVAPVVNSTSPTSPVSKAAPLAAPSPTPVNAPVAAVQPQSSPAPKPESSPAIATKVPSSSNIVEASVPEPPSRKIARIEVLAGGSAPWSIFALYTLASVGAFILLLKHGRQWQKVVAKGEKFVLKHPIIDNLLVLVVSVSYLLSRTSGLIR
jgi:uncharacterized protein YkwD